MIDFLALSYFYGAVAQLVFAMLKAQEIGIGRAWQGLVALQMLFQEILKMQTVGVVGWSIAVRGVAHCQQFGQEKAIQSGGKRVRHRVQAPCPRQQPCG